MKLWFITIITLVLLSGCHSKQRIIRLQNMNAHKALIIQQKNAQIAALKASISAKQKRAARLKRMTAMPRPPKKNIQLKKVEDHNYSSGYMYPGEKKKKTTTVASVNSIMNKSECIGMIGQEKFDKYTQMFGSEAASLKRCKMLKVMKQ